MVHSPKKEGGGYDVMLQPTDDQLVLEEMFSVSTGCAQETCLPARRAPCMQCMVLHSHRGMRYLPRLCAPSILGMDALAAGAVNVRRAGPSAGDSAYLRVS
jgi:hypothetical protein